MDPYALLGVSPRSSEHDVRRAYRRLVRILHPDRQPEHLRDRNGRRLQLVNEARAQVLDEIRREASLAVAPGGPAVPSQRRPLDESDAARRWAARQAWLLKEQRDIDAWNSARETREHGRGLEGERRYADRMQSLRRGRAWGLAPLLVIITLQVGLVLGAVRGIETVIAVVAARGLVITHEHDDLDLLEVLALLRSWRS